MTDPATPIRPQPASAPASGRKPLVYVAAAMLAVVAIAAALIALNEGQRRAELLSQPGDAGVAGHTTVGAPFDLVDQNGRAVTDRSFAGRKRLMVFAPAAERDRILATLQVINSARELAAPASDRLACIWIVTDPDRSSPAQRDAILQQAGGTWTVLTGPEPAIQALMRAFYVPSPRPGSMNSLHPKGAPPAPVATAYLMDEQGSFLSHRTVPPDPAAVAGWLMQSL